ncbi:hypothetical protein PR048_021581 [Dryococelus australis]|uniref:Integrase catalytic domain-containing protein n=1 Tax=Dryococelus australis TaxID=614101 RepID=A0ABQ9GYM8_9NEOP|nr:hypothetical protein PR048_021581 [Dryococelus australis]
MVSTVTVEGKELDLQEALNHLASRLDGLERENSDLKRQVESTPVNLNGDRSALSGNAPMHVGNFTLLPTIPVFSSKLEDNEARPAVTHACLPTAALIAVLELLENGDVLSCPCDVDESVEKISSYQESLLQEYQHIFRERRNLPVTPLVQHWIYTGHHKSISVKPYHVPFHQQTLVQDMSGYFVPQEPRDPPWAFPVVIVRKRSETGDIKYRFCMDFHPLNTVTTPDIYPLPNIVESIDNLGQCKIFSVHLTSGYHQIGVHPDDQAKLRSSLQQKLMDSMIRGLTPTQCMVYIDDFIIFSKVMEQHVEHLRSVFDRLEKANLSLSLEKCYFAVNEVRYLWHVIGSSGVSPDPKFIETVQLYPSPTNVKELQNFLALPETKRPFQRLGLDIVGPIPKTASSNKYILTIIDHFSRYLVMKPLPDETAETVARTFVFDCILKFGVPDSIITDRGTNFVSELMTQLCQLMRVKKLRTTPGHP